MDVGVEIKKARKVSGLTQKELGEKLGVSQQQVAQYESNARTPKLDTLGRIAKALGVTVYDLVGADYWRNKENYVEDNELPDDLVALNSVMNLVGYSLTLDTGEYFLVGRSGRYHLTEEALKELLYSSVQYVEYLCEKYEKGHK